ncbi:MAG: Y-family DNA polymerase [Synergistaceae bacterium]|jgi:DNA polymerase V|nr:Y-family DNA polymerase [Synergistaceae bacterium]
MLALCDCNNFFVSCERLYRPELRGRPVVVLSSNDGCIVSRSDEVKAMGIPMGEPYFRIRGLLKKKGVTVCSGNLAMYGEVSSRVMGLLSRHTDEMEAYSIDEAFLNLPGASVENPVEYAADIRKKMDQWVGIPVSIGLAATKTLSKLASEEARKYGAGVLQITEETAGTVLDATPVGDVWGIGHKSAIRLNRWGIYTAGDFIRKDSLWVRRAMTVRGLVTQLELRGQPCLPLVTTPPQPKSIQVSRTWGNVLESLDDLHCAMTDHVLEAGRQIRKNELAAGAMTVFIRYGYHHRGECGYFTEDAYFDNPILSDVELTRAAMRILGRIYRPGYRYTKGGATLFNLSGANYRQRELFDSDAHERRALYERLSHAVDAINDRLGGRGLYPASLAAGGWKWSPRKEHKSASRTWGSASNPASAASSPDPFNFF